MHFSKIIKILQITKQWKRFFGIIMLDNNQISYHCVKEVNKLYETNNRWLFHDYYKILEEVKQFQQ